MATPDLVKATLEKTPLVQERGCPMNFNKTLEGKDESLVEPDKSLIVLFFNDVADSDFWEIKGTWGLVKYYGF